MNCIKSLNLRESKEKERRTCLPLLAGEEGKEKGLQGLKTGILPLMASLKN